MAKIKKRLPVNYDGILTYLRTNYLDDSLQTLLDNPLGESIVGPPCSLPLLAQAGLLLADLACCNRNTVDKQEY
jgi:hypothetical protein